MVKILGERGSGKTTKLLEIAKEKGFILVEPNKMMADHAMYVAKDKGYNVNVISLHEFLDRHNEATNEKYLVDELELFLTSLSIEGYSDEPS